MIVSSGEILSGAEVYSDTMIVCSGGTVNNVTVSGWNASMVISNGGVADSTIVNNGNQAVYGEASSTILSGGYGYYWWDESSACQYVYSGGTAQDTVVSCYGEQHILSGGTASDTIISGAGGHASAWVSAGGSAIHFSVAAGDMTVLSDGYASDITILDGGYLYLSAGAVAREIDYTPFTGKVTWESPENIQWKNAPLGVYYGSGTYGGLVSSALQMSDVTMSWGYGIQVWDSGYCRDVNAKQYSDIEIYSGGFAENLHASNGARIYVYAGGNASYIILNKASAVIGKRGIADNIFVGESAFLSALSAAQLSYVTVSGTLVASNGAVLEQVDVASGGIVKAGAGASILSIRQEIGGNISTVLSGTNNSTVISGENERGAFGQVGNSASNFILYEGGTQTIYSGAVASNTVLESGAIQNVRNGGTASQTTVNQGGSLFVAAGGNAQNICQKANGYVSTVLSGTDKSTVVNGENELGSFSQIGNVANNFIFYKNGIQTIYSGAIANHTVLESGAIQDVRSGGTASETIAKQGGYVYVSSGGNIQNVTLKTGAEMIVANGVALNTVIESGAHVQIDFNGQVTGVSAGQAFSSSTGSKTDGFMIFSGYTQTVLSGYCAEKTTVAEGGVQSICSGGTATGTVISGGDCKVTNGAKIDKATVVTGNLILSGSSGITASNLVVSGGSVSAWTRTSGGVQLENVQIYGGTLSLSVSATLQQADIFGGKLQVYSGFASAVHIHSGGIMNVQGDSYYYGYYGELTDVAEDVTVSAGGRLIVDSVQAVSGVHLSSGAVLELQNGCAVSGIQQDVGGIISATTAGFYIDMGGYFVYTVVRGTNELGDFSLNNGIASNFVLYSGCCLEVEAYSSAVNTVIKKGGLIVASSYAQLNGCEVFSGGSVLLAGSSAKISGGTFHSGASVLVGCRATVTGVELEDGVDLMLDFGAVVSGEKGGSKFVSSAGNSISGFLVSSGYYHYVGKGETSWDVEIAKDGNVRVTSGGCIGNTVVSSGGNLGIYSNAILSGSIENAGSAWGSTVIFSGNSAADHGGAICNNGGKVTIYTGTFTNNIASGNGGAIDNTGVASVSGGLFTGNTATVGGAIHNQRGSVSITGGTFTGNSATTGGAIYNKDGATVELVNVTFRDNSAVDGGAIYNENSGTVSLKGAVTLASENDTICNSGTLSWNLSDGTTAYGSLAGYQYLTNAGVLSITVAAEDITGNRYLLATGDFSDVAGKNAFALTNGSTTVAISIGSAAQFNDLTYRLEIEDNGTPDIASDDVLVLSVDEAEHCLTITAGSYSGVYDGKAHAADYSYAGKLEGNDTLEVTVAGAITNVGTEISSIASYRILRGVVDVTREYTVVTKTGTLNVTKRAVSISSGDASKFYDGAALTCDSITVGGKGFAESEGASYAFTGSQTEIGTGLNSFTYTLNADTLAGNYDITKVEGTLTVKARPPRVLTVTPSGEITTSLSEFTVTFSEAVDSATLQQNIRLLTPDSKSVAPIQIQQLTTSSYQIDFSEQFAYGQYQLQISSGVTDTYGGHLDQNGNGIGGETDDGFSDSLILSKPVEVRTLTLSGLPSAVTESQGRVRTILSRSGSIGDAVTAAVTLQDGTGLVSVPATVSFGIGVRDAVVYFDVGDNDVLQGNSQFTVTFSAEDYVGLTETVTLKDDEKPTLSFIVEETELTEGESWTSFGKVQIDRAPTEDLRVKLTYDKNQLSGVPDYVVIKAGTTEASFPLTVTDDSASEITKTVKLTASADGVTSGSVELTILDNDIPAIALSVNKTVVSESDGVYALVGTITRTDNTTNPVTVKFTDVNQSGLILPSSVTLGTGAQSVDFYIGVSDNGVVDSDRTAVIKANIYIDSCGCTVQPVSGETQVSFTILDDDGPALGLSLNRVNVAEGVTNAAVLTLTRNTTDNTALTVHLNATGTELLELPSTVTFEAGQTTVSVNVNTLTDSQNAGNQLAVITASAEGYASAVGYLNVADIDLPDLIISNVRLGSGTAYAGEYADIELTLTNAGFQDYAGTVSVKLALSDGTSLGTYRVNGPFAIGEEKTVNLHILLPEIAGDYTLTATVDPDNQISELDNSNNVATSASFPISLDYTVTAELSQDTLYAPGIVTVTGKTKTASGNAVGGKDVDVLISGKYGERKVSAVSDAEGNYSVAIDTSSLFAGTYSVYAGSLDSYGAVQDTLEIVGFKLQKTSELIWDIEDQTSVSGVLTFENASGIPLSDVTISVVDAPANFVFTADAPAALDANGKLAVNYTVTASGTTEDGAYALTYGYQKITFRATSAEGASVDFTGYFYSSPQDAVLNLSETETHAVLYSGNDYYYEYTLTNTGYGDSGKITVNLAANPLITLISSPVIENLAYGESATLTFRVDPTALGDDLALNAAYTGKIAISAENADAVSLALDYTFVTNNKGNISVTLSDEYTYYSEGQPMLSGAKVAIYNAYTNELVSTAYSDENGVVNFSDLAEGKYLLKYTADAHNSAQEIVTVKGGETLNVSTFLNISTVKYTWDVRKVELTDTYEIVLSSEFQTNVPAPVVTIDGPTEIPELEWGESTLLTYTVTNHGLIAANDFTLNLPELQMGYTWTLLNDQPVTIAPNSSISVSVLLERGGIISNSVASESPTIDYSLLTEETIYDENGDIASVIIRYDDVEAIRINADGSYSCIGADDNLYSYDAEGNLISIKVSTEDGYAVYNTSGLMIELGNSDAKIAIEYDEFNNIIAIKDAINGQRYLKSDYLNQASSSASDSALSEQEKLQKNVNLYYYNSSGQWIKVANNDLSSVGITESDKVSVIIHGLNSGVTDATWTGENANSLITADPNAKIIGVDWSEWANLSAIFEAIGEDVGQLVAQNALGVISGDWITRIFNTLEQIYSELNFASCYISAVAYQAFQYLNGYNVENIIGHSYGAHVGGLLGNYLGGDVDTLIGIDPAEEATILVQNFSDITGYFWGNDVANGWGASHKSASYIETYKTSEYWGTENIYGDYNYLLAKSGQFKSDTFVRDLLGTTLTTVNLKKELLEWGAAIISGGTAVLIKILKDVGSWILGKGVEAIMEIPAHSLGQNWIAERIHDTGEIGKWYSQYIPSGNEWLGIVNRQTNELECVTLNNVLNENWNGYDVANTDWEKVVDEHVKYVDFSLNTEDIQSIYGEYEEDIVLYQCEDTYTVCVPIANLANNATISISALEEWQSDQDCSVRVYLTDSLNSDIGYLLGETEFKMPANSYTVVPVELDINVEKLADKLEDSETAYLCFVAGVDSDGKYIDYDLNLSNNVRHVEVPLEKIDCWEGILGTWYYECEGEVLGSSVVQVSTPYCCDFGYKTPYAPSYYSSGNISRGSGGSGGGGGGGTLWEVPWISAGNSKCTPVTSRWVPASAMATPDGGMMSYSAMLTDAADELESVCAYVKMEFAQTGVTCREGFEGTLTLTNQASSAMSNVTFTATVLDANGVDVSELFEINLNGTDGFSITQDGENTQFGLDSNGCGSFTVLYVPGRNAAVNGAEEYQFTGTISYTDSLAGAVSIDLTPITLTVNPCPALTLHYFMERDVYADDPFTDSIEESVPAEISVLVVNNGLGDARNFSLSGFTPSIVENEKGLLLEYTMTEAALNGKKNDNGILDVNFGTVSGNSSAVAQWWYTTNIQGHYSDYSVDFTQMDYSYTDLYGNRRYVAAAGREDVSLIESAEIHELVRSVQCGDDDLPDFLVNDLDDVDVIPDTLYLSTGEILDVNAVSGGTFSGSFGTQDVTITLTATLTEGWNYLRAVDPGEGDYTLTAVTRDGVALNARNFWQTDRYYVDEKGVKYEDRLHFIDKADKAGEVTYTLTYKAKDSSPLAVESIAGPAAVEQAAVDSITVRFNKAVNADTFTYEDLTLYRQGNLAQNLIDSDVTITQIDGCTFTIGNLSGLTAQDGYYQLIVHTAEIQDTVGNSGVDGSAVTWTNAANIPAILSAAGIEDLMTEKVDSVTLEFNAAIDPATLTADCISINQRTASGIAITAADATRTRFIVSGLASLLTEGENQIAVDLTRIENAYGVAGITSFSESWKIDSVAPAVTAERTDLGTIGDVPQKLVFIFSEPVTFDKTALTLKRQGAAVTADSLHVQLDGNTAVISGLPTVSSDGTYELSIDLTKVRDEAGNFGSGTVAQSWTLDQTAPLQIADLHLAPACDLGESSSDNRTSAKVLTLLGTLPESGLGVKIYQKVGSTKALLYNSTVSETALEAVISVNGGNSNLVVELTDAVGNTSESTLAVFVDETAFTADYKESFAETLEDSPDSITVVFSDAVAALKVGDFTLKCDDIAVSLDNCTITRIDAKTWKLSGITGMENGDYTLSLNLAGLNKVSTGLAGSGTEDISWTVKHVVPPTVVSTSLTANQMLDSLSLFSIVFSDSMNCGELIESGAITQAVKIQKLDDDGNVVKTILLESEDFQYVTETNTLFWHGSEAITEAGSFKVRLENSLLRNSDDLALAGGSSAADAMLDFAAGSALSAAGNAYAVPVWKDYNNDGKLDLLIAEKSAEETGKIRLYLNSGSQTAPAFGEYTYLQGASGDWSISASGCLGVAFRFADVSGDSVEDLVYGTSDGQILYALRNGDAYGTGTALKANGNAIDVGNRAVFELYDWNGDGSLDIISGAMDGKAYLYVNNGDWTFAAAQTLDVQLAEGWSAITVADLNGDGTADLVSGDAKGNLYVFLNEGGDEFSQVLLDAGTTLRSRPFAADVNGDGITDLTVGYADGSVKVFAGKQGAVSGLAFRINSAPVFSEEPQAVVDGYTVTFRWNASDDGGIQEYKIKIGDMVYSTMEMNYTLTSVDPGSYSFQIGACDAYGLETWTSTGNFAVADITKPELSGVPSLKQRKNAVTISWDAATDNVGVAGYRVELNGKVVADTKALSYAMTGLALGNYEYRISAYDAAGQETWSAKRNFTVSAVADTEDHVLESGMPTADYGYGCVAASVGMLVGYYDLYGYCGYDVSNLIDGTITAASRGDADALLNDFIFSDEYVSRFVGTTAEAERNQTFVIGTTTLNTTAWNSLADWLGTGQYWRGSADCATAYYYGTLGYIESTEETYSVSGTVLPAKYADFKYGLAEYAESLGYALDSELTRTVKTDTVQGGSFTFCDLASEIDGGRGVLLSLASSDSLGHMVVAYGYNESTGEIIFDDTSKADCRMSWDGTYSYAGHTYTIQSATTVVFDTTGLKSIPIPVTEEIVITANDASKTYDGKALTASGCTCTGLVDGDTIEVVVSGSITDAGTGVSKIESYRIMRDDVDVTQYYTFVTKINGTLSIAKRRVTLTSGDASKVYDGTPLTNKNVTVSGDGFVDGEATASASTLTDAGTATNTITINEGAGYKASNYDVSKTEGTLTVTQRAITITVDDAFKTYDGSALSASKYTLSGTLAAGDELTVTYGGALTDAGTAESSIATYQIKHGDKDVTANYAVTTVNGTLTVNKRSVTLISGDASKVYDGTPLTCEAITVTGDGFAEGEGATYSNFVSPVEVGSCENTFDYTLNGNTKAGNYDITEVEGMLTVLPRSVPTNLSGNANGISWEGDCTSYVAEYTQDGYTTGLRIQTANSAVDAYGMPEGTYDWRVRYESAEQWAEGSGITAAKASAPEEFISEANGIGDLFFGRASEVWTKDYMAQHLGFADGWGGTKERVALSGKNRITDVFAGSGDANLLVLTDDGNGDALFVDDVYSAFPEEEQSRLSQLDEIWAGAGNDVIDMTSQEFVYSGDGLTLRGGSGDDTIWSNEGDNFLFGDAGNDRLAGASGNDVLAGGSGNDSMQGGGGKDIFTFGANWGSDTVEQLDDGSITLWFAEDFGLTFKAEGDNTKISSKQGTILVKGLTVSETKSCCRYGSAGYEEQYSELVELGAFAESSTSSIFDEEGKGRLAML